MSTLAFDPEETTQWELVSHEEIGEHKAQYSGAEIVSLLLESGFERSHIRHGTFELGMNVWAVAHKA